MTGRPFWAALLVASALGAAASAQADGSAEPPNRPMQVQWADGAPQLGFVADDFVSERVAEKLKGGLPQRIVTRVYAYLERGDEPLAVAAISCRIAYDLWEGLYRVQLQTEQADRSFVVSDLRSVTRACVEVHQLSFAHTELFAKNRGARIYFAAMLELNPLSSDTVQRIRRWLSKSGDGQLRGDAFFGSFVSVFVTRRMGSAEHSLTFRSGIFIIPP